jgi:hypothetical protein
MKIIFIDESEINNLQDLIKDGKFVKLDSYNIGGGKSESSKESRRFTKNVIDLVKAKERSLEIGKYVHYKDDKKIWKIRDIVSYSGVVFFELVRLSDQLIQGVEIENSNLLIPVPAKNIIVNLGHGIFGQLLISTQSVRKFHIIKEDGYLKATISLDYLEQPLRGIIEDIIAQQIKEEREERNK